MANIKVEIPFKSKGGSGAGGGGGTKLKASIDKLTTSIVKGSFFSKLLSDIFGDVYSLISPLIRILSVLAFLILLPLLPLLKILTKGIAFLAKVFSGKFGDVGKLIGKLIFGVIAIVLAFLLAATAPVWVVLALIGVALLLFWDVIVAAGKILWGVIKWLGVKIGEAAIIAWEFIKVGFEFISEGLKLVWENLKIAWEFLIAAPEFIWNSILKPAFEWLKDVGSWIWNIIKSPFQWLADKVSSLTSIFSRNKRVNDAIIRPNGQVIETSPQDTLIATKNPEKLGGGGGISVTINNPSVRNDMDIKKIADQVSRIIQRKSTGRFS